jgi:hypothetical protein
MDSFNHSLIGRIDEFDDDTAALRGYGTEV